MDDLAKRAVVCRGWKWMEGMRWVLARPLPLDPLTGRVADSRPRDGRDVPPGAVPDLDDPATRGCLLELVRQAWGDPSITPVHRQGVDWWVHCGGGGVSGPTEAAALVTALEAAS